MDNKKIQQEFSGYLQRRYGDRSTPEHYKSDVKIFLEEMKQKSLNKISSKDIDLFVESQQTKGMSAATINRRLAALRSLFEFLASIEPDKEQANPVQWRRHSPKQGEPLARDASDADIELLFKHVTSPRDEAMFGLMVGAGLRVGEVAQMKVTNLYPPETPSKLARLIVCGKGHKERVVWLTETWYEKVLAYQQERSSSEDEYQFLNHRGRPISVNGIQYRIKQLCKQAGVDLSCHQLRHTFARRLANQKMPIESISKLMGHNQIETTQRYTVGADPELQAEFELIMDQMARPETEGVIVSQPPRLPRQKHLAPLAELESALTRYVAFPPWLQGRLEAQLRHRWPSWKPHMAAHNAHRTTRQLAPVWEWLLEHFSLTSWDSLKRTHVEQWLDHELERGLAPSTVVRNLNELFSFLQFVLERADQPIHLGIFRIKGPKRSEPLPRHLDEAAYQQVLQTMLQQTEEPDTGLLHRTWFLTLAFTGIRLSELLDLRISDLDLNTRRLFIHDSKNDHGRVVFMTPTLVQHFQAYLAWRPTTLTDHLFISADGQPLSPASIQYHCRQWGAIHGITLSPHRLRHTFATRLLNQGLPLESIRRLLGHKTLSMTQRYARLHDSTARQHFEAATAYLEGIHIPEWPALADSYVYLSN